MTFCGFLKGLRLIVREFSIDVCWIFTIFAMNSSGDVYTSKKLKYVKLTD